MLLLGELSGIVQQNDFLVFTEKTNLSTSGVCGFPPSPFSKQYIRDVFRIELMSSIDFQEIIV